MRYAVVIPSEKKFIVSPGSKGKGRLGWTTRLSEASELAQAVSGVVVDAERFLKMYSGPDTVDAAVAATTIREEGTSVKNG